MFPFCRGVPGAGDCYVGPMFKRLTKAAVAACLASALAFTGAAAASSPLTKVKLNGSVKIGVVKDGKLGKVLVDGDGHVLYMFAADKRAGVACDSECQSIWPPLVAPKTGVAKAVDGARQSLIWSDKNRYDGKRIVTYDGWPLYTYVTDQVPGRAGGQNHDINGGYWWVIHPDGQIEK
jgi:predicted lipoprotein with Yx(FWY)xxD motif